MTDPRVRDEAAYWMARARDPRFADWDALSNWLEADPARNLAYEAAFTAHDLSGELDLADATVPAPQLRRAPRPAIWLAGVLGAAAAAATIVLVMPARPSPLVATTRPGEQRVVALADGTRIALNGGSKVVIAAENGRNARLDRGEAMFSVVHDESRPFTVDVGGQRLVDIGTRFDVVRGPQSSEIAVAEGAVLYDPEGAAVRLGPGRVLRKHDHSSLLEVADVDSAGIGAWRAGRLIYHAAPLARVAEDLVRLTGERMEVAPDLAARSFTGVIIVPVGDRGRFMHRLGLVLDVDVASGPRGYYLKARASR